MESISYYARDAIWSFQAVWTVASEKLLWSVPIALVSATIAAARRKVSSGTWGKDTLIAALYGAIGGPVIILIAAFLINFIRYPSVREAEMLSRLPPEDISISVPRLDPSRKRAINERISSLADLVNGEGNQACKAASDLQSSYGSDIRVRKRPAAYAAKARATLSSTRNIYRVILGPNNDAGLLRSGDPLVAETIGQLIQSKDRDIIIQFDGYALMTLNVLDALAIADESDQRSTLMDPLTGVLSIPMNLWGDYTAKFCALLKKTNDRITDMRAAIK
jgi:hypothetical protein